MVANQKTHFHPGRTVMLILFLASAIWGVYLTVYPQKEIIWSVSFSALNAIIYIFSGIVCLLSVRNNEALPFYIRNAVKYLSYA